MTTKILAELFERDIQRVINELNLYEDENKIWIKEKDISNSAGNLALHLIGNLNHFIGFALGNTGYVRQRELEFSTSFSPRAEVVNNLTATIEIVKSALSNLKDENLSSTFPIEKNGQKHSVLYMLLHLLSHLDYHLGQINYHRRLIA